ncbi:MAG: hypothetical protein A2X32_04330 [Elusimicrobia bacterium GWC2_64_44]|nr:MAG: hypothetical protein A2X32_04330 [Elusimicrobia bacterium GWC2_64_44]
MHKLLPSLPETVSLAAAAGKFKLARALMDKLLAGPLLPGMAQRLEFEKDRLERLRKAYPYDRAAALKILRKRLKNFRSSELDGWIQAGYAAPRLIDGREMFMDSFASNIVSCDRNKLVKRIKNPDKSGNASFARLMARVEELAAGAAPARYRARARVTLTLNSAPKEKVRCWLPFPRVGDQVSSARLIAASHKKYKLAKPGAEHRTIYMEGRGRKFFAEFEYEVSEWVPAAGTAGPVPAAARKYLAEEPPHIVFTPYARKLAAEIVGKEKDNYRKARRIYDWLTDNLTYNFTLPYGVFENISDYALTNLRGDCGFMALAFITLCRAAGVPAKWQSGWAARPGQAGSHDWAMFYAGCWRPVDVSFGRNRRVFKKEGQRRFYFGNLDGGRMVANSELGAPLWPAKKFRRSDPTDNQRGEAETASGNLYFDQVKTRIKLLAYERLA